MLTVAIRTQIDKIRSAFWSEGVSITTPYNFLVEYLLGLGLERRD